jgi:tetratricopeptide (TPR) repeat protein
VDLALAESSEEGTRHHAAVTTLGLDCALSLGTDEAGDAIARFERAGESVLETTDLDWPADERSGLYRLLVVARDEAGDEAGAQAAALRWLEFLEDQAANAADPEARTVFDSHRLSAAIAAGDPLRAVPGLMRSESDFPEDYNPPSRLALAYLEADRTDDALAAVDRALARVDGPRRLRVLTQKAGILEVQGNRAGAREVLEQAVNYAESLPPSQISRRRIDSLRQKLDAMN